MVDVYNASSRAWTTAQLSEARSNLAAASLDSYGLILFAGGSMNYGSPTSAVDAYGPCPPAYFSTLLGCAPCPAGS